MRPIEIRGKKYIDMRKQKIGLAKIDQRKQFEILREEDESIRQMVSDRFHDVVCSSYTQDRLCVLFDI